MDGGILAYSPKKIDSPLSEKRVLYSMLKYGRRCYSECLMLKRKLLKGGRAGHSPLPSSGNVSPIGSENHQI
jgi:hypothetical protein